MEGQHRGRAWTTTDRYGNEVYLTWERWDHIIEFHPESERFVVTAYQDYIRER